MKIIHLLAISHMLVRGFKNEYYYYNNMDIIHENTIKANYKTQTEYRINEYLSLKLENKKTVIFVAGKKFRQCKYLLLNVSKGLNKRIKKINSIDELAEHLNHDMERNLNNDFQITPEEEFWGHCSNLQVWYENGYDSRLLHSNLAFPLLKRLTLEGDPQARKVFKEEIVKRIESGYANVVNYLIGQRYLNHLQKEELIYLTDVIKDYKISKLIGKYFYKREINEFAILFFKKGLKLNPNDKECQFFLREIFDTPEEKRARYAEILKKEPHRKKIRVRLLELYTNEKKFKKGLEILDKRIALEYPKETHKLIQAIKKRDNYGINIDKTIFNKSLKLWRVLCGKLLRINRLIRHKLIPELEFARRIKMLYKEKIKLSNKLRLFSKEIVYFSRKALEYNDSMIDFKEYMGETFYLLGRFDEAIKVYKNLLEIAQNPRKDKHKLVLGKIFIELHDHNKAVEVLKDFEWKVIKSLNFKNILKENIDRYKFYQFSFLKKISNYYFQKQQYQKALNAFKDLFLDGECCFLDPKQEKDLIRKLIACYRNTHQINRVYELIGLYFPGWEYNEIILNKLVKFIRNNYTKTNN